MYCNRFVLGAVAAMMLCSTAMGEVLISPTVRNGSFELLGPEPGAASTAKAQLWTGGPNGDVTFWKEWGAAVGGPSIVTTDSGTENIPADASNGTRVAFFQGGDFAYNLTSHVVQPGDTFKYSWDFALGGRGNAMAQLAYQDASNNIVAITGTDTMVPAGSARTLGVAGAYTVSAGDPAIGHPIAFTIGAPAGSNYPEVDNIFFTANLIAGDVNGDGHVNATDFGIIRDHFQTTVASRDLGDLNNDQKVNFIDYLEWRANAGAGAGSLSLDFNGNVPEPTALVLATLSLTACLASRPRRRRHRSK
jgi:Dockerin type I domain